MTKQILVKVPLTTNGIDIVFDENDKRTYTESILLDVPGPQGARAILEKRNTTLPVGLRVIITDYVEPEKAATEQAPETKGTLLDQLKIQAEKEGMQAENEMLKEQLAAMKAKEEKANAAKKEKAIA